MEAILQPPQPFVFENNVVNVTSGNLSKEWDRWKKSFEIYYAACELNKKDPKVQINILLHIIGEKCRDIFDQFTEKFDTVTKVLERFDTFFFPKKNLTIERHRFFIREQGECESVEQYVFELNKMAAKCEFKDLCQDLVRDRLICGIRDGSMRERLLREPNLTLTKAVDICNLAELSRAQAVTIKTENADHYHVHEISQKSQESEQAAVTLDLIQRNSSRAQRSRSSRARGSGSGSGQWSRPPRPGPSRQQQETRTRPGAQPIPRRNERNWSAVPRYRGCRQCGRVHPKFKCPAYGQQCLSCKQFNHYSRMCGIYEVREDSSDQDKLLNKLEENEPELASSPEEECVICVNAKATMQTSPCGHRVVCRRCFVKTIQMAVSQRLLPLRCVICRAKILRLRQEPRLVTSKSWQVSSGSGKSWGVPGSVSSYSVGARSVPASASLYSVTSGESSLSGVSSVSSNSGGISAGCSTKLCGGAKCGGACLGAVPRAPAPASAPPKARQPASNSLRRSQHHSMKARLQDYQVHSYTGGPAGEPSGRLPPIREFQREFREGRRESAAASASTRIRCAQKIVTQLETSPQKNKDHFFRPLKAPSKDDPPKSRDHSKETERKKDNPKTKPKKEEKKKKEEETANQEDKNKKDESTDNRKNEIAERKKEEKLRLKAEKEAKKEAKQQAKEEERQAKLLAKEEERQAKLLAKEEKKKAKKEAKLAAQAEKEKNK